MASSIDMRRRTMDDSRQRTANNEHRMSCRRMEMQTGWMGRWMDGWLTGSRVLRKQDDRRAQNKYNKYTCGQMNSPTDVSAAQNLIKLLNLLTGQRHWWSCAMCIKCSSAWEVGIILTKQTPKAGKASFDTGIEPRTVCEIYANLCQAILCPPSLQFRRDTLQGGQNLESTQIDLWLFLVGEATVERGKV